MKKKDKCARCGKPMYYFREILTSLGNGYRRYKLCPTCADLVEKAEQARKSRPENARQA